MAASTLNGKQWRFEAIDLRAGMAITLWREQRTTAHGLPQEQVPALFFSPPHFQPEPVVNTAVALSACRGTFEPGLYIDGGETEASFTTPDEVAEFLRRAYVNGASGDGVDGGEPGPAPPLPGRGEGSPEPLLLFDSSLVVALAKLIDEFGSTAEQTAKGTSFLFSWGNHTLERDGRAIGNPPAQAADAKALATAALALIEEMLGRMPALSDATAWLTWYDDVRELACLLLGLGVAEQLLDPPHQGALDAILVRSRLIEEPDTPDWLRFRLGWLFLFGPPIPQPNSVDELYSLLRYLDHVIDYPAREAWIFPLSSRVEDPLDILSRLPLPQSLHCVLPDDVRSKASLYHLLNLIVSEPQAARRQPAAVPFAVCLTLFAAACIVASRTGPQNVAMLWLRPIHHSLERARRAAEQGHAWLIEHLPRLGYAASYEAALGRSKTLRYTTPPDSTPPVSTPPQQAVHRRVAGPSPGLSA